MGGGLMQLVAYGAQDIYLTGNPQITFFKVVYRRHTNFSMECIKQSFKGTVGSSSRVVATISRNGDLVHDCFLKNKVLMSGTDGINIGHQVIDNIEVEIGGQLIDKHYGHWMETHAELTEGEYAAGATLDGKTWQKGGDNTEGTDLLTNFQLLSCAGGCGVVTSKIPDGTILFTPLRFWFCRHVGLSLPLIALQYHEVNINVTLSGVWGNFFNDTSLWCNYIYLDTDERRRFAQVSHEYLIEQVQLQTFSQTEGVTDTFKLNFNHPVKELIWSALDAAWGSGHSILHQQLTAATEPKSGLYQLKLNGHDRFEKIETEYFTRYQIYKYHPNKIITNTSQQSDNIAVYSFALKPEEHQPSGTCNFSRIDNAQLISIKGTGSDYLNVYAVNYNVLRIMSGMGGLAYSN
tara:strand:- start:308 stop:1522 length:1215 start_codon:yes stop_codon:yes gene_type:complete